MFPLYTPSLPTSAPKLTGKGSNFGTDEYYVFLVQHYASGGFSINVFCDVLSIGATFVPPSHDVLQKRKTHECAVSSSAIHNQAQNSAKPTPAVCPHHGRHQAVGFF